MASVTPFNAAATLGAFEISALVSYALLGLTITQTYIYYRRFPDDSLKIKPLVAFFCLSEVAHAICLGHALYALTISDYGQLEHSVVASRSFPAVIFLSGIVAASVETFFAFRIYALSKKLYIPIFSWIMSGLCVVGRAFGCPLERRRYKRLDSHKTLLLILVRERSNAHKRTVALMDKLIMYTIKSGMLISASSIATLTCLVAMKDNLIWGRGFCN
ncbi:hypothetical protein B0H14DRAFT_3499672 [Mycena olivaceomarginata]|nr:hypothetical protein B0H14DRAFT_3499672 [Mycena olivaceomarginata]